MPSDKEIQDKIQLETAKRLLVRYRKDLDDLRFSFTHNEKNLLALIKEREEEIASLQSRAEGVMEIDYNIGDLKIHGNGSRLWVDVGGSTVALEPSEALQLAAVIRAAYERWEGR